MSQDNFICPVCGEAFSTGGEGCRCSTCGYEAAFVECFANVSAFQAWKNESGRRRDSLQSRMIELGRRKPFFSVTGGYPVYRSPATGVLSVSYSNGMQPLRPEVVQYSAASDPPINEVMLMKDGTVSASGFNRHIDASQNIQDVDYVLATGNCTVCRQKDGSLHFFGQYFPNVNKWSHIISMVGGPSYLVGLTDDGRVLIEGALLDPSFCDTIRSWTGVTEICSSGNAVMALHTNGMVSFAGVNQSDSRRTGVNTWTNIQGIALDDNCAYGLTSDGHILMCETGRLFGNKTRRDVVNWENVISIRGFQNGIAALFGDGSIRIAGNMTQHERKQESWNRESQKIRREILFEAFRT